LEEYHGLYTVYNWADVIRLIYFVSLAEIHMLYLRDLDRNGQV